MLMTRLYIYYAIWSPSRTEPYRNPVRKRPADHCAPFRNTSRSDMAAVDLSPLEARVAPDAAGSLVPLLVCTGHVARG